VWLKDGVELKNTSLTIGLSGLKESDAGVYSVRITTDKNNVVQKDIFELSVL